MAFKVPVGLGSAEAPGGAVRQGWVVGLWLNLPTVVGTLYCCIGTLLFWSRLRATGEAEAAEKSVRNAVMARTTEDRTVNIFQI